MRSGSSKTLLAYYNRVWQTSKNALTWTWSLTVSVFRCCLKHTIPLESINVLNFTIGFHVLELITTNICIDLTTGLPRGSLVSLQIINYSKGNQFLFAHIRSLYTVAVSAEISYVSDRTCQDTYTASTLPELVGCNDSCVLPATL